MRKRRSGFTIVEILVFSTIALLFLSILFQLFVIATKRTEDARLRVDLQQKAILVLRQFERDFSLTSPRGLTGSDSSDRYVLAFTPIQARNPGQWRTMQTLYVYDKEKKSVQWREALDEDFAEDLLTGRPYLPTIAELQDLAESSTGKARILSEHVEDFSLWNGIDEPRSNTQFHPAQPVLELEMRLRRPLSHSDRFAEFTVERRYHLRNNY